MLQFGPNVIAALPEAGGLGRKFMVIWFDDWSRTPLSVRRWFGSFSRAAQSGSGFLLSGPPCCQRPYTPCNSELSEWQGSAQLARPPPTQPVGWRERL